MIVIEFTDGVWLVSVDGKPLMTFATYNRALEFVA